MPTIRHQKPNRARSRAMTLIEVLIVLAICVVLIGGIAVGGGQVSGARLRQSATLLAGGVRVGFTRANATSKSVRMVLDLDASKVWLEEADAPFLAKANDKTHNGGADPATVAEQAAVEEGDRIIKGPRAPRPHFHMISTSDDKPNSAILSKSLPSGIHFRSVQTAHDDHPVTSGRAYLYFWPGGETERASIQTCITHKEEDKQVCNTEDSGTFSMMVAPLTGKVTVKPGSVDLKIPTDDVSASDRLDPGTF
ncbi:MAG: prepilin-type N-terminal cleavage/methylation domain-containing protein [Polyangiaceae bacterium]